ncbi:MAG: thymidine phosphorylase [Sandaracinus sp.]|nr:thymidine phosphorylase [Sandaracinus sp.]|tara:strand:+ start:3318 stop:4634 length:1317 start_codon:yes stop_codon:yes gene_type:complete
MTLASPPELIIRKREGGKLSDDEIRGWIDAYVRGDIPDYQMAAMAMAIFFQGMTPQETAALTMAMRDSGQVIDLDGIDAIKVDKHSTGGVGDKVSLCLAPIVAACGVPVPMVAGRGLGHTGGTLDKLEAIPGFRCDLSTKAFVKQVETIGCAIFGQTAQIAPADRQLYALRDVTGTIESIPLITGSILSKKLAEGIDALVMDIKVGQGAFMRTTESARELARSIVRTGKVAGKKVSVLLTRMDAPLGRTVGNAIETKEAFEVLHGGGPEDLVECTLALGAEMLRLGGVEKTEAKARARMQAVIADGSAVALMEKVVKAQGGDPRVVAEPDRLVIAPKKVVVKAPKAGYVAGIDAREIGLAGVDLGAGRTRSDQDVDHAVSIVIDAKPGEKVAAGDPLATLFVHDRRKAKAPAQRVAEAFRVTSRRPTIEPLVIETIRR